MRLLRIFIYVLIVMTLAKCGSSPCGIASLDYGLIGFSDSEAQNIILRKFQKNNNFSNQIDSVIIQATFTRKNDTLEIGSIVSNGLLLSQYDYEVNFPNASRLFKITNIIEEQSEIRHSIFRPTKEGCINRVTQLTIDGQIINTVRFNRFYIVK